MERAPGNSTCGERAPRVYVAPCFCDSIKKLRGRLWRSARARGLSRRAATCVPWNPHELARGMIVFPPREREREREWSRRAARAARGCWGRVLGVRGAGGARARRWVAPARVARGAGGVARLGAAERPGARRLGLRVLILPERGVLQNVGRERERDPFTPFRMYV